MHHSKLKHFFKILNYDKLINKKENSKGKNGKENKREKQFMDNKWSWV